jgi:hypothetical protein
LGQGLPLSLKMLNVSYIRLAVGKHRNLSVHPSLENKIQSRDKCINKKRASRKKAFPCDTALAITFRPTGGWCQPTYLSKALQQLNNLILTPKNGESRDFGPYSGQIPTFSNSQSYMLSEQALKKGHW